MQGHLFLLLHAHLPYVRHTEHERFLEESWFYEGVIETYLPLWQMLDRWREDQLPAKLTLTLSPTLCTMLRDPLLVARCTRRLDDLIALARAEIQRTTLEPPLHSLARFYHDRFRSLRAGWDRCERDLVGAFGKLQQHGRIEIITCAATHALLPFIASHTPSLRAQILTARDDYRRCFGCDPRGIWLPECAYVEAIEPVLKEAELRWFALEAHGVLHAQPRPRYGVCAPVFTSNGLAAFGRDLESARQVWSRTEGYPGDPRYRDFYRDIGYDLDFDYVQPCLPSPDDRGFTGIKYHRITGPTDQKATYERGPAMEAAHAHARHFLDSRIRHARELGQIIGKAPAFMIPYDAELFGHWWYEGIEFLDQFVRLSCAQRDVLSLTTPSDYLGSHPTHQVTAPAASSWGEHGYYKMWLNETNDWIVPHLDMAQRRMTDLANQIVAPPQLERRALNQAARELLLAQASDWPFILRTGSSPGYARQRVNDHLVRFTTLHDQLRAGTVDETWLAQVEATDAIFPEVDYRLFTGGT